MDRRLKEKIGKAIKQNCFWLEPVEDDTCGSIDVVKQANFTILIEAPAFALRVKRGGRGFVKNRIIRISERMLDEAVERMSSDSGFKKRSSSFDVTIQDVETIISIATYGTVKLDLYDF